MRILFVSRAFPPTIGGIEQQNADLARFLGLECDVTIIVNRRGRRFLPLFYPWAILRTLFLLPRHDVLLLGDGVLGLLGVIAKLLYPRKTVLSIFHGLDITYPSSLYQRLWVRGFFLSLDGGIAVSQATKDEAVKRGLDGSRVFVIPNGIEAARFHFPLDRNKLSHLLGFETADRVILLTIGRLVKRKGVAWFIREVLPGLPPDFHYVIAGSGPEEAAIRQTITAAGLASRVTLLGRVSAEDKKTLLGNADIFVQPNISVPGDMEGFGIAVIEASAAGLPVIASNLEGLADAVTDGGNGQLVSAENPTAFRDAVKALHEPGVRKIWKTRGQSFTAEHFDWSIIAKRYVSLIEDFVKSTTDSH